MNVWLSKNFLALLLGYTLGEGPPLSESLLLCNSLLAWGFYKAELMAFFILKCEMGSGLMHFCRPGNSDRDGLTEKKRKASVKANGEKNTAFLQLGSVPAVIPASYISTIKCKWMQSFILAPGGLVVWKDKRAFSIVYLGGGGSSVSATVSLIPWQHLNVAFIIKNTYMGV